MDIGIINIVTFIACLAMGVNVLIYQQFEMAFMLITIAILNLVVYRQERKKRILRRK